MYAFNKNYDLILKINRTDVWSLYQARHLNN